jgi:hypothetical protein
MGVGTPANILEAIEKGIDMFDCVLPTRNGRNGMLFTSQGIINIKNRKWIDDFSPKYEEHGGLLKLSALLKKQQQRRDADIILSFHTGDTISPSLVSSLDKGASMIKALNTLALDAFDDAPKHLNHLFTAESTVRNRICSYHFPLSLSHGGAP